MYFNTHGTIHSAACERNKGGILKKNSKALIENEKEGEIF